MGFRGFLVSLTIFITLFCIACELVTTIIQLNHGSATQGMEHQMYSDFSPVFPELENIEQSKVKFCIMYMEHWPTWKRIQYICTHRALCPY